VFDHYKDVRECLIEENSELKSNKTYIEAYTILIESHNTLIESHKTWITLSWWNRFLCMDGWKCCQITTPGYKPRQHQTFAIENSEIWL